MNSKHLLLANNYIWFCQKYDNDFVESINENGSIFRYYCAVILENSS